MPQGFIRWNRWFSCYFFHSTIGRSTFGGLLFWQFPDLLSSYKFYSNPSSISDNSLGNRTIDGGTLADTSDNCGAGDACFFIMDKKSAILESGSQIISMADTIGICYNYFSVLSCLSLHPKDGSIFKSDAMTKVTLQKAITIMKNKR